MKTKFFKALSLLLAITMLMISTSVISGASASDKLAAGSESVKLVTGEETSVTVGITSLTELVCYGIEGNWDIQEQGDTDYFKLTGIGSDVITFNEDEFNFVDVATGKVLWVDDKFDGVKISDTTTNLLTATYSVAAGTPEGEYTVRFVADVFTDDSGDPDETQTVFEVKITVSHDNMVAHSGEAATCEVDGWLAYYECSVCGKLYSENDCDSKNEIADLDAWKTGAGKIDATGHDYDDGVVTTDPTCEEAGVKTFTCQNDSTHTYTEPIPATDHNWGTPTYTINADGTHTATYTCGNDASHTKSDEPVAHDFTNGDCVCGAEKPVTNITVISKGVAEYDDTTGLGYSVEGNVVTVKYDIEAAEKSTYLVGYIKDDAYVSVEAVKNTEEGTYSFTVPEGVTEVVLSVKGDVNLDGVVRAADVTALLEHVAGIQTITDVVALANGEVTGDKEIHSDDVTKITEYRAGIISSLD